MTRRKSSAMAETLRRCRVAAGLSKKALAERLRLTPQSIARWEDDYRSPSSGALRNLVRLFYEINPALAQAIADAAGEPLATFGILPRAEPTAVATPPIVMAPPSPPSPPISPRHAADSVVCAASEDREMPLAEARLVLLAGFRRAKEMGLTVEMVEAGLALAASSESAT
jgi:transcriptional regulator with XRE-family HTH domain